MWLAMRVRGCGHAGEHEDAGADDGPDPEQGQINGAKDATQPRVAAMVTGVDRLGSEERGCPGHSGCSDVPAARSCGVDRARSFVLKDTHRTTFTWLRLPYP